MPLRYTLPLAPVQAHARIVTRSGALTAVLVSCLLVACGGEAPGTDQEGDPPTGVVPEALPDMASGTPMDWPPSYPGGAHVDTISGTAWTVADWAILESAVVNAVEAGVAEIPLGEAVAEVGRLFVGWPYTPQTLEAPWIEAAAAGAPMDGSLERLVVNLREFDCVTFVENVLALTWFVREHGVEALDDRTAARGIYEDYLIGLRYRGNSVDGYASRLHYFSEWLSDNAARGALTLVHPELDPALDPEPIDFMTTHIDAYPALADDPASVERIGEVEARLNAALPRPWLPADRIADVESEIRTGDVIAATSTVTGLDVAHTGIAVVIDGRVHLMHAPLVGSEVQVSPVPLADRILRIDGQDGLLVARPQVAGPETTPRQDR